MHYREGRKDAWLGEVQQAQNARRYADIVRTAEMTANKLEGMAGKHQTPTEAQIKNVVLDLIASHGKSFATPVLGCMVQYWVHHAVLKKVLDSLYPEGEPNG